MKKLVITGASSFIGKAIIRAAMDAYIYAVVRKGSKTVADLMHMPNVKVIEMNMEEYAALGNAVGQADCFIHLAWSGTRGADRMNKELQNNNYLYSMQAIESMIEAGCRCILTAGSQAEYGNVSGVIKEDTLCCPNTMYGQYKHKLYEDTYKLCKEKGVSFREPRIFSIYGPGDYKNTLIMSLIRKMMDNEPCDLTACTQKWDYLHVDDVAQAILTLCKADCPDGVYNLASGDVRTLREYVEELREILKSSSVMNYGAIPYPPTGAMSIEPSVSKIQNLTGWKPQIVFSQGIKGMI